MTARRFIHTFVLACMMLVSLGSARAAEPPGVPAGKPYQVAGVIEWVDLSDNRLVVDGISYRYHSPVVHAREDAPSKEVRELELRLRPGMKVGLRVGRGDPRPILEVWILR